MPSQVWGRVCHFQPALPDQEQPGLRWRLWWRLPSDSLKAACRLFEGSFSLEMNTSCTCRWGYIGGALPPSSSSTHCPHAAQLPKAKWMKLMKDPLSTMSYGFLWGHPPCKVYLVWHLSLCQPSVCQVQAPVLLLERHKVWRSWCSWQGKCVLTEKPA